MFPDNSLISQPGIKYTVESGVAYLSYMHSLMCCRNYGTVPNMLPSYTMPTNLDSDDLYDMWVSTILGYHAAITLEPRAPSRRPLLHFASERLLAWHLPLYWLSLHQTDLAL